MIVASLPPSDHNFVGRDDELAQVRDHLLNNHSILLHGEPGIGKTALAVEALHSTPIQNAYRDRMLWLERTAENLTDLCDAVARAVDAQAVLQTDDLEQKIAILRATLGDSLPLLVFNNADGKAAPAVAAFCEQVSRAPMLVTSRDLVDGPDQIDLTALPANQARELFIDRSREPLPAEEDALADILTILEGNPQALLLTARRFRNLEARNLIERLRNQPFEVLVHPQRANERSQSIPRAFGVSYDLLETVEQHLFAALGIFAGPDFSLEAVQALFDEDITLALGRLIDVSLVRRSIERFSVHPLLKEYARGKQEPEDGFQLRLAAYYAGFVQEREDATAENLDAIAAEFANIRGVVAWCSDQGVEEMPATILTDTLPALQLFLIVRGYWRERIEWGQEAVEAARVLGNDQRVAIMAGNLATAFQDRGDLQKAEQGHRDTLAAFERMEDEGNVAVSLHQLGILAHSQGRMEEARGLYSSSLEIRERLGDERATAQSLHELGRLAQNQGRLEEGRDLYTRSLEIKRRPRDQQGIAVSLGQLANLENDSGNLEEAQAIYAQVLDISQKLGDLQSTAQTLHNFGILAQNHGQVEEARDLHTRSLEIKERLGDAQGIAETFHQLGILAHDQGEVNEARDFYARSLEIKERLGDQQGIAFTLHQLGRLDEDTGQLTNAHDKFQRALEFLERLGSPGADTARRSLQRVLEKLQRSN